MKVTQEKLPASQIGLEIEIAPEKTKQTYEEVVKKLAKTTNIPGFRKGKVPRPILLQSLGSTRVKAAALEEIVQDGINEAIEQQDISAIGQPELRSSFDELIGNYEPGKSLIFSAAVDVEPQVNLGEYKGLQFQSEEIKYEPVRVEEVLNNERQQMATLIPVEERAAELGDVAVLDFKGVIANTQGEDTEPEPIPGGEGNDFQVDLQEDKFIPGFIIGIVGMNPGETREISAKFPDPYANEELAGKDAIFTVTLKELKEKELPALDDDFAKEASEFETLEELQNSLSERFQKEAEEKTKNNKQEALLDKLLEKIEVDLPETMIQQEVDGMLTQTAIRLSQQGVDVKKLFTQELIPQLREQSRNEAIQRIKHSLGLQEIAKRESIEVSDSEVEVRVKKLMEEYSDSEIDSEKAYSVVENELLTEKIIDWLLDNSSVELVPEGTLKVEAQAETEVEETDTNEINPDNENENKDDISSATTP